MRDWRLSSLEQVRLVCEGMRWASYRRSIGVPPAVSGSEAPGGQDVHAGGPMLGGHALASPRGPCDPHSSSSSSSSLSSSSISPAKGLLAACLDGALASLAALAAAAALRRSSRC